MEMTPEVLGSMKIASPCLGAVAPSVRHTARLPADAEGVRISIAAVEVVCVRPLVLAVVIESGKETGPGREKELDVGCRVPGSKSPGLNLPEIAPSDGPIQPRGDAVLKGEINTIRVLIGN